VQVAVAMCSETVKLLKELNALIGDVILFDVLGDVVWRLCSTS